MSGRVSIGKPALAALIVILVVVAAGVTMVMRSWPPRTTQSPTATSIPTAGTAATTITTSATAPPTTTTATNAKTTTPSTNVTLIGYVPPSVVGGYLGGSWSVLANRSGLAIVNASSDTITAYFLNGTVKTVEITSAAANTTGNLTAGLLQLGPSLSAIRSAAVYTYVAAGGRNLSVVVIQLGNVTLAYEYYAFMSGMISMANMTNSSAKAVSLNISGAQVVVAINTNTSQSFAVALKDNYLIIVSADVSSEGMSNWEGLVTQVIDAVP